MGKSVSSKELTFEEYHGHRNNEEKFRQLIKNSFDMIVLMSANGIQHYVSESCENILGYKPHELTEIPVIDVMIHPDDREKVYEGFKGILLHSKYGGTQYRHRHKNGGWVYLEAFGTNQLDNPVIQSIVLNVRDISARKKAEESLKKSEENLRRLNSAKDRFLSIIGHDLRNPLSSVIGFSELLIKQLEEKNYKDALEFAEIINRSSIQAVDLLKNLLLWAKTKSGRLDYSPEILDCNSLVSEVVHLLQETAKNKSITITNNTRAGLMVFSDRDVSHLILRNLISNGIKFTPEGGEIVIGTEINQNDVIISVADNGVGMEKDELENLFHLDHKHTSPGTDNETGTGLGLLLCKEFTDMYCGEIWAESIPGKGSTFYFTIPVTPG